MDVLFDISKNLKLQAWLDDAVTGVCFCHPALLEFDVKAEQFQGWMRAWSGVGNNVADDLEFLEWTKETGLDLVKFIGPGSIQFYMV